MGGFLYFVPEHITRVEQLGEWGLGFLFARDGVGFFPAQGRGLDGVQGTMIGDERLTPSSRITYRPAEQIWKKRPTAKGDVWVGMYKDAAPVPADLVRRDALDGHTVRLGDDHDWLIPVARGASEENGELRYASRLPRRLDLSEAGAWVSGGIVPRFAELWAAACAFWNAFVAGKPEQNESGAAVTLDLGDIVNMAVLALSTNYRMGAAEAALLGLLDEDNCVAVCKALVDLPTIERFLQKKTLEQVRSEEDPTPAGSNVSAG